MHGDVASEGNFDTVEECEPVTGDAAKWIALLSIPEVPLHISDLVFDDDSESDVAALVRQHNAVVPVGWLLIMIVAPGLVLWWQYRRMAL